MSEENIENLQQEFMEAVEKESERLFKDFSETPDAHLEDERKFLEGFTERLHDRWGRALALYEISRNLAFTIGEQLAKEYLADESREQDLAFELLARLHARLCLIAYEVQALMKSGLASGALSRWRAMHEIHVCMEFIAKHPSSAMPYIEHEHIESAKTAFHYNIVYMGTDEEIPSVDIDAFEKRADELKAKYGKGYEKSYGWAAVVLGKKGATFEHIESEVQLDHLRPDYKMASHSIHGNAKGAFFDVGQMGRQTTVMLAGPSNAGLADPGCRALRTLTQATATLATLRSEFEQIVLAHVLLKTSKASEAEFMKAHKLLVADEERLK